MNTVEIVKRLNAAKKNQSMTLKQLSEKSGISLGTVNKIMSGALLDIKTDKLNKLARALNVSTDYLLNETANFQEKKPAKFFGLAKVACVSPKVRVGDCQFNAKNIVDGAKKAIADGAKIVLFPELCITAYSCGDLFFQSTLRTAALDALAYVTEQLKTFNSVVVVGLPLTDDTGKLFNVAAVLYQGEILGIVPKTNLPNYNEFFEKRLFTPAPEVNSTVKICGKTVPFGTKLIFTDSCHPEVRFAVEICEDIWVAESPSFKHSTAGANLILNLSASDEIVTKAEYRKKMIEIQSAKAGAIYAYCSSGDGESTSEVVFSAHNIICENGLVLAESKPFKDGYALAEADFEFIQNERAKLSRTFSDNGYQSVYFDMPICDAPTRCYDNSPFVPADKKILTDRCETVLQLQSHALKKRLEHTRCSKLVIGVSGGSDSTLALLVCKHALDLLNRDTSDIVAITMPCFGTTQRTLNNSIALATALNTTVRKIDITAAVTQHLQDIGHDGNTPDVTFENAQARERTQVLMDIANSENGLVIGTGDLSELALGWATYNGDHMSMYGVNSSVPKTLVRALIAYEANRANEQIRKILLDVLDTPISPELLPPNDENIVQVTEDLVGPYRLHDYFLYMLVRKGFSPSKVFAMAKISFNGEYTEQQIYFWLNKFIRRFFTQQFKRSCSPDCVKIGTVDLSQNGWRVPSDACCDAWIADLETMNPAR